jgi:hypothetical protein
MSRHSAHSRRYHEASRAWLDEQNAAGVTCWTCHHPHVDQVDHDPPQSELTEEQKLDPVYWRPSHGVRGCPTCGVACNQSRGTKPAESALPRRRYTSKQW